LQEKVESFFADIAYVKTALLDVDDEMKSVPAVMQIVSFLSEAFGVNK